MESDENHEMEGRMNGSAVHSVSLPCKLLQLQKSGVQSPMTLSIAKTYPS